MIVAAGTETILSKIGRASCGSETIELLNRIIEHLRSWIGIMITSARFAMWHITVLIFTYALIVSCATAAEVTAHKKWILLEGTIEDGDFAKFEQVVYQNLWLEQVYLASPGGNVAEAIKIGNLIRHLSMSTIIPYRPVVSTPSELDRRVATHWGISDIGNNYVCASACFFIHVAGVFRTGTTLGIHRPFFDAATLKDVLGTEAIAHSKSVRSIVEDYLQEMGVPSRYSDLMFSTAKDEIRWISSDEISDDFTGPIPELADWMESRCGKNPLASLKSSTGSLPPNAKAAFAAAVTTYLDCEAENFAKLHMEAWVLNRLREAQVNPSAQ